MTADPWERLRRTTPARIALGRAGDGLPTRALLEFQRDHALARDAVHARFAPEALAAELSDHETILVESRAGDRATYLQRPDLGRLPAPESARLLTPGDWDAVFVLADGLSAGAVQAHAVPLLRETLARLPGWRIGPVVLAGQARVALGDAVGAALGAALVAVLIGERPGLTAPDSLGVYLTWNPRPGCPDSARNCLSNIRPPAGLSYPVAAERLAWLMTEARRRQLTGVGLKEDAPRLAGGDASASLPV